jgi:transcriptional regulator with XRE-family HTH domain
MTRHKLKAVKRRLKHKGWTHEAAAEALGRSYEHLNRVLNGHRVSASLVAEIESLPAREVASAP